MQALIAHIPKGYALFGCVVLWGLIKVINGADLQERWTIKVGPEVHKITESKNFWFLSSMKNKQNKRNYR